MLAPGDVFEQKYEIIRELGRGAFAVVYLALERNIGREVALKILKEGRSEDRFVREAKLLSELRSPHTVTMLDFGWSGDDRPYMIFEYVPGETLESRLEYTGPMPGGRVANIVRQMLHALGEAHDRGIVHRDVKPANVMMTVMDGDEDFVKVLDFGVAKPLSEVRDVSVELTTAGQIIGTMRYMSPEQLRGERKAVPASDVYAVGLIAYEMLTGEKAASGDDSRFVITQHLSREPYLIPEHVDVPLPFRDAFEAMMRKDVEMRPRNAREAVRLLEEIDDETTTFDHRMPEDFGRRERQHEPEKLELDEVALAELRTRNSTGTTDRVAQQEAQDYADETMLNRIGRALFVGAVIVLTACLLIILATVVLGRFGA